MYGSVGHRDLVGVARSTIRSSTFVFALPAAGYRWRRTRAPSASTSSRSVSDRRVVDVHVSDARFVRRPPVACRAPHLLLRDELGNAVLDESLAVRGDGALPTRRELNHKKVLVADEADVIAARGKARVGFVTLGRRESARPGSCAP